ncbi:MAG TPA: DUF4845 domain-containing protein [Gammaproteobacteria bacterium]|nr:DUF4845 domain-containing protein [Gammaproteobacteria bacterium]
MKVARYQKGMTAIGWLLVLGLIAFFTLIALRLVPLYMEYGKVVSVMESLANEPNISTQTRRQIISLVGKRFDINDVSHVDPKLVKISKDKGRMTLSIEYERREHLMGNVDVVARFSKTLEVGGR